MYEELQRVDATEQYATLMGRGQVAGVVAAMCSGAVAAPVIAAGGFPAIPLMEDIALSKRLKRMSRPLCLRECVVTSGRRWETNGVLKTIVLMWRLRLAYFFGADPNALARQYGYE